MDAASSEILDQVALYYSGKLKTHGATPKGVDWRDSVSQERRFARFNDLLRNDLAASVADVGCGYGGYLSYLRRQGFSGPYLGIDVSAPMIASAEARFQDDGQARFTVSDSLAGRYDYVIASGIFNVRLGVSVAAWEEHIAGTIEMMANAADKGFAFNCLSKKVDYRRGDLYYGDPDVWLEFCRRITRGEPVVDEVPELHDFTIFVRRDTVRQEWAGQAE